MTLDSGPIKAELVDTLQQLIKDKQSAELVAFVRGNGIDLTKVRLGSWPALHFATKEMSAECALKLAELEPSMLHHGDSLIGATPLHYAAMYQLDDLAKAFLGLGAPRYAKDMRDKAPHDYSRNSDMTAACDEDRDARPRGIFAVLYRESEDYKRERQEYARNWLERKERQSRTAEYDR